MKSSFMNILCGRSIDFVDVVESGSCYLGRIKLLRALEFVWVDNCRACFIHVIIV